MKQVLLMMAWGLLWAGDAAAQGAPGSQPQVAPGSQPQKAPGSQPQATSTKIMKPGTQQGNVELPDDPFVRCALASKMAQHLKVKQSERRARINAICAPLFKQKACHDGLKDIYKKGAPPAFATCAAAYCKKLKDPKPSVCDEEKHRGGVQARAALIRRALILDHGIKPLPLELEAKMGTLDQGADAGKRWQDIQAQVAKMDLTDRQRQMWGISFVLALMTPANH
ncbi:MAG: hypothetical protein ACE366_13205 [Bradymonadia bacterium]